MKRWVVIYLGASALLLLGLPVVNLWALPSPPPSPHSGDTEPWWQRSQLYRTDLVLPYLNRVLVAAGISTEPSQAVVGKSGWLFLGDAHGQRISIRRRGADAADTVLSRQLTAASAAWAEWFAARGVRDYRVMLAADKGSVYPEFLPGWAAPVPGSSTDALMAAAPPGRYIDTRAELQRAKAMFDEALYYQNNTHWNALGAWVAFRLLARELALKDPSLKLLDDSQVRVQKIEQIEGGDLAAFLRQQAFSHDRELTTAITTPRPIDTEQVDVANGQRVSAGGNPRVGAPVRLLRVASPNALNPRRVLWLRDSFGVAMSPYVAATFNETLQIHYSHATPAAVAAWVEAYKPDYVLVTVVERDARLPWFTQLPPRR